MPFDTKSEQKKKGIKRGKGGKIVKVSKKK